MDAGRSRLIRLNTSEIEALLAALPFLSIWWARPAQVSRGALQQRQAKTVRAVRAKLARSADAFHHGLAWAAIASFAEDVEPDDSLLGLDAVATAEELATGIGTALGADLGAFVVNIVAECKLPLAEVVRGQLDRYLEIASRDTSAQFVEIERPSEGGTETSSELADDCAKSVNDRTDNEGVAAAADDQAGCGVSGGTHAVALIKGMPGDSESPHARLARLEILLNEAPSVAGDLHDMADEIEVGRVPVGEPALIRSTTWLLSARDLVADAETLGDAAASIREDIQASAVRLDELKDLALAVDSLQAAGHAKPAFDLLRVNNFLTPEDLARAIGAFAPEDMGHSRAVADTETQPETVPVFVPSPTLGLGIDLQTSKIEAEGAGAKENNPSGKNLGAAVLQGGPSESPQAELSRGTVNEDIPIAVGPSGYTEATRQLDLMPTPVASPPVPVDVVGTPDAGDAQTPSTDARVDKCGDSEGLGTKSLSQQSNKALPTWVEGFVETAVDEAEATPNDETAAYTPASSHQVEQDAKLSQDIHDSGHGNLVEASSDPWTDGTLASLIVQDRERMAVIAAEALGATAGHVRMLRLFAGAFGTRADTLLAQEPELTLDEAPEGERNTDDSRLLFAAHARLALELGFSPAGSLERFRQAASLDGHAAGDTASELVRLATRGFKRPPGIVALTGLPDDWRDLADTAAARMAALPNMSISYQRASRIIHHLARANQPVGAVLAECADLASRCAAGDRPSREAWGEIESVLAVLRDPQQCERLLNDTDRKLSTSHQLRNPIVASARDRMFSALNDVADLLEEALALRARAEGSSASSDPQGMADLVAIAQQTASFPVQTVGDAALKRLVGWVRSEDVTTHSPAALSQLISDELLPLYEIPRDVGGAPLRAVESVGELQTLVNGREPLVVVRGYLGVGNIRTADQVLLRSGLTRSVSIDDEFAQSTKALARRHRDLTTEIDRILGRLRSLFDDDLVRQLGQELEDHREPTPGRYDLHVGPLEDIRNRGDSRLDEVRAGLRERTTKIHNERDAQRIIGLLESRDEQLAVDYLSLAEAGEDLPVLTPPAGDDFGVFFPEIVRVAEAANKQRAIDNITDVRKHLGASGNPKNRMLNQGLKSWTELVIDQHAVQMTEGRLANVLRMLGLIPSDQRWVKELTKARHAGYATYAVKATPIDRSYVPSLGTQAHGSYDVTIVWDEASPKRLLQYVETNRRTQANVILYLRTLSVEQRIELRKLTARAGSDFSPIVVDMPVIAWLSVREEPGWRLTQRVTLPFTTLNPYTPFAGGEVPDEVFVGREAEQREIIEPTGSMFVYGGRQLGKSALLRRVERGLMSSQSSGEDSFEHGHIAVYLDLKSEGIGESAPPSALWAALAMRLARAGVLANERSGWTVESVTSGILEWLDFDTSRRLLVLLDEADNFLTLDAQDTGPSQAGGFPVLQKLKGLMERTGRRFKPVFAGLHQVQRFHGLPNTPVVHGGQDILIGPLKSVDARELVRDPLYALGYDFETPDTMWRLLRLTNYQASLIQIICEALVRHMRGSSLPREGGRVIIRARDVDDVYAKRDVRDLIAQRFRWTINLDNRYRVIALVTAVRSLDSKPGERFRANELHDECEYFWPAGFSRNILSSGEFLRYLDEMKGLGVLHQQGDEFGLRSPSILGLLGSKDTIEAELVEASDQLEVGYQYNPTMNRRILTQDAAGVETRSPLPDSELAGLLSHGAGESRVKIVTGTSALGLHRVIPALQRAATERDIRLLEVSAVTLRDQIGVGDETHLAVDLTTADMPTTRWVLEALACETNTFVTIVMLPDALPLNPGHENWPVVNLQRWTVEGLQSWHESPFRRQELKNATGGWPDLVEEAISLVMRGASTDSALTLVAEGVRDPVGAREFLASTGVPIREARTWLEWFGQEGQSGTIEITPASIDDLNTAFDEDVRPMVERLQLLHVIDEVPEGWLLDRVVALATRHLQE